MNARILGLGTATPTHSISQEHSALLAGEIRPPDPEHERVLPALYRRTGIRRRGSVLLASGAPLDGSPKRQLFFHAARGPDDLGPGTGARSDRFAIEAPNLAARAAHAALDHARPARITHLVTASCTGFGAPGVDAELIEKLSLDRSVQRTNVGFMGCHGAINGLRVARALALSDPGACVLLCAVELCSLHFHYTSDPEAMVANALFADGAAAAVIGVDEPKTVENQPTKIAGFGSCLLPDSRDAMTWRIGDHGFVMTLSPRVPELLSTHVCGWLVSWLSRHGLDLPSIGGWAIHPGGPRVLSTVAACLGLTDDAIEPSRAVLAEHGNMSSPTVLFILDRLRRAGTPRPWVAMAFGPGLTIEAALLA